MKPNKYVSSIEISENIAQSSSTYTWQIRLVAKKERIVDGQVFWGDNKLSLKKKSHTFF